MFFFSVYFLLCFISYIQAMIDAFLARKPIDEAIRERSGPPHRRPVKHNARKS